MFEMPAIWLFAIVGLIMWPFIALAYKEPKTMTPIDVMNEELKRINLDMRSFHLDGTEKKDDPVILMFNDMLKQRNTIQSALIEIAKRG